MVLQASGAISLSQIAAEFGDAAPHRLGEFYRGGGLVGEHADTAGIPTSGEISFSDFYAASGGISLEDAALSTFGGVDTSGDGVTLRYASIIVFGDGTLRGVTRATSLPPHTSATTEIHGNWINTPRANSGMEYQLRASVLTPTPSRVYSYRYTGQELPISLLGNHLDIENWHTISLSSSQYGIVIIVANTSGTVSYSPRTVRVTLAIRRVGETTVRAQKTITATI